MTKEWPQSKHGGVAQLGEHLPCKQGVMGSNPIISSDARSGRTKRLLKVTCPFLKFFVELSFKKVRVPLVPHGLIAQLVRARA